MSTKIGTEKPQYKGAYHELVLWLQGKFIPFVQSDVVICFIAADEIPTLGVLDRMGIGSTTTFGDTHHLHTIALSQFL